MIRLRTIFLFPLALTACMAAPASDPGSESKSIGNAHDASLYSPGNRYGWGGEDTYLDEVQPLLAQRCVSCHGCADSPCQLKLTSYEGLRRGSNEENIFGPHPGDIAPTRLEDYRVTDRDGQIDWPATEENWRDSGYYSVTDGGEESLMYRLLEQAHRNPAAQRDLTPALALFEEGLAERTFECVGPAGEMSDSEIAARAMPFGMEQLSEAQFRTLTDWLKRGAKGPSPRAEEMLARPMDERTVEKWESFFNPESEKGKLVTRYLYEHLFFAHLHFPQMPGEFYQLVRSRTAYPEPIDEIVTGLPRDRPDAGLGGAFRDVFSAPTVYYRLKKYTQIIVQKSHIAWELNDEVMAGWRALFLEPEYEVDLPGYFSDNPFSYFDQIPGRARARFMIENSLKLVGAMVTGDVCTGTRATYAIRDRFWVWFLDPDTDPSAASPLLGNRTYAHLDPAGHDFEGRYQRSFESELRAMHPDGLSLDALWDGDGGTDPNAWLTVMRHGKSATVHLGATAGRPETMWVLSYSNFERLYYNLVVNFQAWGSLPHKITIWKYMSRVRTEGEDLFLSLLPEAYRQPLRDEWTQDFGSAFLDGISDIIEGDLRSAGRGSLIDVGADDPMGDLMAEMRERVGDRVTGGYDALNPDADPGALVPPGELPERVTTHAEFEQAVSVLAGWRGPHAQYLPNLTIVRTHDDAGETRVYTIAANRGYLSHDLVLGEGRARNPELDVLSAARGILGNYPELFIDIPLGATATAFINELKELKSEGDWQNLQMLQAWRRADE